MDKHQKGNLYKIIIAGVFFALAIALRFTDFGLAPLSSYTNVFTGQGDSNAIFEFLAGLTPSAALFFTAYFVVGYRVLIDAFRGIAGGQVLDENFLMTIASLGALILGELSEGVAVMLFFRVGEFFEDIAVDRSRKSIESLVSLRPDYAVLKDGTIVDPEKVEVGTLIMIKPGEKVPLDGLVIEGLSSLDTAALTGESMPRDIEPGHEIYSGSVNLTGVLIVKVTKVFEESTVSKILELVENAGSKKAESEKFITKFARVYTPAVVGIAVFLALVPPLILPEATFSDWVYRAMIFLVISCPCALVISVPLSFFAGIGSASALGVLVKGSNYLEALSKTETVVFDKTGTLTTGIFSLKEIFPSAEFSGDEILEIAAKAEYYSSHPLAISIKNAYQKTSGKKLSKDSLSDVQEISGKGVYAKVYLSEGLGNSVTVHIGNRRLVEDLGLSLPELDFEGSLVHLVVDGVYAGSLGLQDPIKDDSLAAIEGLNQLGIENTVLLTGDLKAIADKIGGKLGLKKVHSQLLPTDKVDYLEEILKNKTPGSSVIFLGDGINDAPALARADVGIAMGGLGSDAAIEAADIVIMTDEPSKLPMVIKIAKKTVLIAKENIVFALGVKGLVLVLGAMGLASMWAAVFADVGVSMLAILNAIRLLRPGTYR